MLSFNPEFDEIMINIPIVKTLNNIFVELFGISEETLFINVIRT